MKVLNPYCFPAGRELDAKLEELLFGNEHLPEIPCFSSSDREADKIKSRLKILYGHPVIVGKTTLRDKRYFARLETGPSTSTEVLAETYALAVSRLGLVFASRRDT